MDMTKFEHEEDPGFIAVAGELRRWVKALTATTHTDIPPAVEPTQPDSEREQGRQCKWKYLLGVIMHD
jgi:hypothetical protein